MRTSLNQSLESCIKDTNSRSGFLDQNTYDKLIEYMERTERNDPRPLYHKASKDFLRSYLDHNNAPEVFRNLIYGLARIENSYRRKAIEDNDLPPSRDHVAHSVGVFLIGLLLISRCTELRRIMENWQSRMEINHFEFIKLWAYCAFWHDIGYPMEISIDEEKKLWYLNRTIKVTEPKNIILERIKNNDWINISYNNAYFEIFRGGCKNILDCDHGLASASILYGIITEYKIFDVNLTKYVIESIAFHNLKPDLEIYPVSPDNNPLTWLLIACDEIQHWSRPSRKRRAFFKPSDIDIKFSGRNKIALKYQVKTTDWRFKEKEDMIKKSGETIDKKLNQDNVSLELSVEIIS